MVYRAFQAFLDSVAYLDSAACLGLVARQGQVDFLALQAPLDFLGTRVLVAIQAYLVTQAHRALRDFQGLLALRDSLAHQDFQVIQALQAYRGTLAFQAFLVFQALVAIQA